MLRGWVLVLETLAAVGMGGLIAVAVGMLRGRGHRLTPTDTAALAELGLRLDGEGFVGELAGLEVRLHPEPGGVQITAVGLDEGLVIEAKEDGPSFDGTVPATRSRRKRTAMLWSRVLRGRLEARHRALHLEVPTFVAASGQLGSVVQQLEELLQDLVEPVDWTAVVRDAREALPLRLEGLRRLDGAAVERVAPDLLDDSEAAVRCVAQAVCGDPAPLEAHCRDEVAAVVVPVLSYLPDALRGGVLAARVTGSEARVRPFVQDLVKRRMSGQAPIAEMRALASSVHAASDDRDPLFGQARFSGWDGAIRPFAIAVECVAKEDAAEARPWVPLCLEMLAESAGPDADALVDALIVAATVEDVPALQRIDTYSARGVVAAIQARVGADRGGLALADTAGGELAVAAPDGPAVHEDETG